MVHTLKEEWKNPSPRQFLLSRFFFSHSSSSFILKDAGAKKSGLLRFRHVLAIILCLLGTLAIAAQTITVPGDYTNIQDAINAAQSGDVIEISPATYNENLVLNKNITLRGTETARVLLNAGRASSPVLTITGVSFITISKLSFVGDTIGIQITNSNNVIIAANVFSGGTEAVGIQVTDASSFNIINNTFFQNGTGIKSQIGPGTLIQNNLFASNERAIDSSSNNNIVFNGFFSNTENGQIGGDAVTGSDPKLVDSGNGDFHLMENSMAFDKGTGPNDVIDDSRADLGAYGGNYADPTPFPVQDVAPTSSSSSGNRFEVDIAWSPNNSYLINNYLLYYYFEGSGSFTGGTGVDNAPSPLSETGTSRKMQGDLPSIEKPIAPQITAVTPKNQGLLIAWNTVNGATGYKIHYGVNSPDENTTTDISGTNYTLTGLTNGTTYQIAVSALRQAQLHVVVVAQDSTSSKHTSEYSSITTVALGDIHSSDKSNTVTGIPDVVVPYPALPDEGCFIATAAYGSYSAEQVQALRDFRDRYLLAHAPGRTFVRWYYTHSPPAAHFLNENPTLKPAVRAALLPMVLLAQWMNHTSAVVHVATWIALLLTLGMWIQSRRRLSCV